MAIHQPVFRGLQPLATACLTVMLAVMAGCGGSNSGTSHNYSGNYQGTFTFSTSQTGTLSLTVSDLHAANAKLVITGSAALTSSPSTAHAMQLTIPATSINLSGTVNAETGTFTLFNTYTDSTGLNIPLLISGRLPTTSDATPITARIGLDTFSGTLSPGGSTVTTTTTTTGTTTSSTTTGSTTVGITTGTTTATTGTTTGTSACGGTILDGSITNLASANVTAGTFQLGSVSASLNSSAGAGTTSIGIGAQDCFLNISGINRTLSISLSNSSGISAGTALALGSPGSGPFAYIQYTEAIYSGTTLISSRTWASNGGTITVDTMNGTSITFHTTDAQMQPLSALKGVPPQGTFTLSVTGTATVLGTTG